MIGLADPKLWNLGVGILSKWNGLSLLFSVYLKKENNKIFVNGGYLKINIVCYNLPHIFFVLRLIILPQPGLGRIAEQVKY